MFMTWCCIGMTVGFDFRKTTLAPSSGITKSVHSCGINVPPALDEPSVIVLSMYSISLPQFLAFSPAGLPPNFLRCIRTNMVRPSEYSIRCSRPGRRLLMTQSPEVLTYGARPLEIIAARFAFILTSTKFLRRSIRSSTPRLIRDTNASARSEMELLVVLMCFLWNAGSSRVERARGQHAVADEFEELPELAYRSG